MNQSTFTLDTAHTDASTGTGATAAAIVPGTVTTTPKDTLSSKISTILTRFTGQCKVWLDRVNGKIVVTNNSAVKTAVNTGAPAIVASIEVVPGSTGSTRPFQVVGGTPWVSPTAEQQAILDAIEPSRKKFSMASIMDAVQDAYGPNSVVTFDQATNRVDVRVAADDPAARVPADPGTQTVVVDFTEIFPVQNTSNPTTPFGG